MIKLLHIVAIGALISSATYAYTIKYDTLLYGEQLAKLKQQSLREREAIAVLKAEWQHLNRPDRLQALSERHLQLQPLAATQLVRFSDIPDRGPKVDDIGKKLEALGLMRDDAPTASITRPMTQRPLPPKPVAARLVTAKPVVAKPGIASPASTRPAAVAALTPKPATLRVAGNGETVIRPPASVGANTTPRPAVAAPARPSPRNP
jgi:hypothetical protein